MGRPESVTNEDLTRWSDIIDSDPDADKQLVSFAIVREVCYAGLWMIEKLRDLDCPEQIIARMQYHGGKLSFGRETWEVHQKLLADYIDNKLLFEDDPNVDVN